ncbi:MAG: methyltransferase [Pseudomonadota bacterium]
MDLLVKPTKFRHGNAWREVRARASDDPRVRRLLAGGGQLNFVRDRWLAWRDALLQKPGFIRWASRFPLTKPMARRRTRELFDLAAGFVYTQILTTCVRLNLFEHLRSGPKTVKSLAQALDLPVNSVRTVVKGAQALDLIEERGDERYGLGQLGAALLANPGVIAMVHHHALLYQDLRDPVALLRDPSSATSLSRYWAYAQDSVPDALPAESVASYSQLMASSQDFICAEVLDAYPVTRHQQLLDIGGGEGRFAEAAMMRSKKIKATVFDLPAVAERAELRFADAGFAQRGGVIGGDFFVDSLPQMADLVTLVRVLHDHDDDKARKLLDQAHSALLPGGTVVIAEPMADTPGAKKAGDAYFGFYLMAMRSGRPRTFGEIKRFLADAGFDNVREHQTSNPLLTRVISAKVL